MDKDIEGFYLVLNNYGENFKVFVFIDFIEGMMGFFRVDFLYILDCYVECFWLVVVIVGIEMVMNKFLVL